ncbi:MAG: dTDP-4-dehydrorhamnose 3,5-epimerase family protein [Thiohalophilus sp.]|nr:dTDP-4-dehydrorhamnose 3,5-epimerase family protein [Thiohalophilus sp.]MDZ7804392.1 dTDP-4-dehydrorhamnose 3,5-epimerase family protein [Thiohalophilus sp.]
MSRLQYSDTPLPGLRLIQRQRIGDHRGFMDRLFCAEELAEAGWVRPIAQINHTYTHRRGTVRGMHFQSPPHAEMKLVTCLRGAVWDVAIDLRPDSPTFLAWHGEELSPDNQRALLIPEGFAHGFQALTCRCRDALLPYRQLCAGCRGWFAPGGSPTVDQLAATH